MKSVCASHAAETMLLLFVYSIKTKHAIISADLER